MTGIVIIDKPAGWTSMDVCAKIRGVLREKHVGHGGTLDPMATGVLPVFLGKATKAVEYFENAKKRYTAAIRFGVETDTQDITGTVLKTSPSDVTEEDVVNIIPKFLGKQTQIPPMYSAVKIGGKKLYEIARKGGEVERAPREIEIESITVSGRDENGDIIIDVTCSKGTYVRTLCADIGKALGCGACMASLRRTQAGMFSEYMSVTLENFLREAEAGNADAYVLSAGVVFAAYPRTDIDPIKERTIKNGGTVETDVPNGLYRVYARGLFLMLGRAENGILKSEKNFFEVQSGETHHCSGLL